MTELPIHIIEKCVSLLGNKEKAICKCLSTHFNKYIGNVCPKYIKLQMLCVQVLDELCSNSQYAYFNVSINSANYRIIISDENNHDVYVYVVKKGLGGKTVTRTYKKDKLVSNLKQVMKRNKKYGTLEITEHVLYHDVFSNIRSVSCVSGKNTPNLFMKWKNMIYETVEPIS
jgi:hypothetical protein